MAKFLERYGTVGSTIKHEAIRLALAATFLVPLDDAIGQCLAHAQQHAGIGCVLEPRHGRLRGQRGTRALYATYVSFLLNEAFCYPVPKYADARGMFVEMLRTPDCGQFSFFTAHPGITRGGHYHHIKAERLLVIKGHARYRFRHLLTDERYEVESSGEEPVIVETIPGWAHDITNVGEDELVVMLWRTRSLTARGRIRWRVGWLDFRAHTVRIYILIYVYPEDIAMKVAKWGNSLAVRLPAAVVEALQLQDGDEVEIQVEAPRVLTVVKKPDIEEMFARVRKLRGAMPKDFKFDREEANER